jgi:ubiquinone/menaquinone biosynthesis C-methylase UbiE
VSQKNVDWGKGHRREALIWQRKGLWREDTLRILAAWLGLKPGMTALDVGCGLGYLGYTWWPFFGHGGRYIGVDISEELIADAQTSARDWADGGQTCFVCGDAYDLPVEENSVLGPEMYHVSWTFLELVVLYIY